MGNFSDNPKTATINIRVDESLKKKFILAAIKKDLNQTDVLVSFIKWYVEESEKNE